MIELSIADFAFSSSPFIPPLPTWQSSHREASRVRCMASDDEIVQETRTTRGCRLKLFSCIYETQTFLTQQSHLWSSVHSKNHELSFYHESAFLYTLVKNWEYKQNICAVTSDHTMIAARCLEFVKVYWQSWIVALAPLIFSPILFCGDTLQVQPDSIRIKLEIWIKYSLMQEEEALKCGYIILLMILFWLTEALPLPVTAMIPMVSDWKIFD